MEEPISMSYIAHDDRCALEGWCSRCVPTGAIGTDFILMDDNAQHQTSTLSNTCGTTCRSPSHDSLSFRKLYRNLPMILLKSWTIFPWQLCRHVLGEWDDSASGSHTRYWKFIFGQWICVRFYFCQIFSFWLVVWLIWSVCWRCVVHGRRLFYVKHVFTQNRLWLFQQMNTIWRITFKNGDP